MYIYTYIYIYVCVCVFPAKPWSKRHVWIGVCFGGMFRARVSGDVSRYVSGLLTKGTLWEYVSGYVSEGSNMRPFMNS